MKNLLPYLLTIALLSATSTVQAVLPDGSTAPNWTLTDINGNTYTLYDVLDQGKMVALDFSATWCPPCWNYHQTHAMEDLYNNHGPDGTDEVMVFWIEGDLSTNSACLYGPSGCNSSTMGDWVTGTPYPIFDLTSNTVRNQYNVTYWPTIYAICPDRTLFEASQASYSAWQTWIETCSFDGTAAAEDALCVGGAGGSVDLTPSGGYGGITYSWSNGATTQDISDLPAGNYSVTMTEGHGYSIELGPYTVGGPANALEIVTNTEEDIDCSGNANGIIDISPTGGTPGYSLLWSNGETSTTISNLTPGNYTVSLTDANNCIDQTTYIISEPPALTMSTVANDETCGYGNGEIIAQGDGGSPTYSYDIGGGPQSVGYFSDLVEGVYSLSITDANGCMETEDLIIINIPAPFADAGSDMSVDCSTPTVHLDGSNSSSGSNISYLWDTVDGNIVAGGNTSSPVVNAPGYYELLVYDNNTGCESFSSVIVTGDIEAPNSDAGPDGLLSCSNNTITLDGTASDEGPNITYEWSTANGNIVSGGTTTEPVVDASGTYSLIVTDTNNGCSATSEVEVTADSNLPEAEANADTPLDCTTTQVTLDGVGSSSGTDITYLWSTSNGNIVDGANTLTPLVDAAGTYSILVTNNTNGCTATATATVTQNAVLPDASAGTAEDLDCATNSLTLDGNGSESGSNITYQWSTANGNIVSGATTTTPVIDAAGDYTILVTNTTTGCTSTDEVTVAENTATPQSNAGSADPITCSNNTITLDGSGSSSGTDITYQWSTSDGNIVSGGTTTAPEVDEAGTYSLLVTNNDNGCTATASVSVSENTATPLANAGSGGALTCETISITLDGSESSSGSNFSYSWTTADGNIVSGADTDSPVVDEAGSYSLVVTNTDNGCSATANAVVSVNANLPDADAGDDEELSCSNNTITLNGNNSSGGSNIEYQWSTADGNIVSGGETTTPEVDEVGEYTLIVTNTDNGCSATSTVQVGENLNTPLADAGNEGTLNCNNNTVTLDGTGSSTGDDFEYEWDTDNGNIASGANTATPTVDEGGTYILVVTNTANGCTSLAQVDVNVTPPLEVELGSQTNATCNGANNASASIEVSGGTGNYEYDWPGGGDEATVEDLSAGTYVATVTDADDCTQTISIEITEPDALSVNADATNESSSGANDGTASANPEGGAGDYEYSWSNGETTANIEDLEPGLYTVEITDANGCTTSETVTVNSFNCLVTADIESNNIDCFNANNGTATASMDGGNGPFSYEWSNGETTATIDNLAAGTYEVTISDDNNCPATALITITQPTALSLNLESSTQVTCAGATDGAATVSANGGNNTFTYAWSNGASEASVDGLSAGAYEVTATDGNQCETTLTVVVTEPTLLDATTSSTGESAAGANDGTATANPTGGTTPYSYQWSNGATTATATDLAPGTYSVIITDGNGCTASKTIVVDAVDCNIVYALNSEDVTCFAANNGTATVDDSGSTSSFTYNWSNGATTASVSNLPAGTYEVSISDDLGCQSVAEVVITEPAAIEVELITAAPNCAGENNGSISLNTSGGSGDYNYSWQDGSTGNNYLNAGAGIYAVTATDSNGCTEVQTTVIVDPAVITASTTSTNTSSANTNDGTATVNAIGGNGTFSFLWSNGETTQTITDLAPGIYEVVITDGNGCTTTTSATVQGVDCALSASIINSNIGCAGDTNGSATITITGGSGEFQYEWSNAATTQTVSDLAPGTYTVTATDMVGCVIVDQVTIIAPEAMNTISTNINQPNCFSSSDGMIELTTTGGSGGYTYMWSDGSTDENLTNASAGDYTVEVTDANGCNSNAAFSLTAPAELVTTISDQTNVQCGNDGSGTATVVAEGGTGTITYEWSNGQTNAIATGLNAGTYNVVATDANGCVQTNTVTITAQDNVAPEVNTQSVSISLDDNGIAMLEAASVNNNSSDNCELTGMSLDMNEFDCSNLGENIVQLTVTDGAGNTSMATAMVTVIDNTDPTIECASGVVTGSCSEPVEYDLPTAFDNCSAAQPELLIGLGSGAVFPVGNSIEVYRVTDASGNSSTCSFTVVVEDDVDPVLECPENIVLTGCDQEVNYSLPMASDACSVVGEPVLTMGMGTGAIFPEGMSTETYEVADAAGNTTTCSFTIQINNTIDGDISSIQNPCFNESNGSATVLGQGGVPPYDYNWDNGQTGTTATDLTPDLYSVIVTDATGCSNEVFVTVVGNPEITTDLDNLEDESGNSGNGSISITSNGGSGSLSYEWTADNGFESNEEDIDGLSAGTYTCIITDEEGCTSVAGPFVVASVSGINDPELANQVRLYPNPTDGAVQIQLSSVLANEDVQFEVFSITGQAVGIQSIIQSANNVYTMDISNQVNGVYLVKIRIGEDLLVKRIVLNRN